MEKILVKKYASPCGELLLGSFDGRLCLCNWVGTLHPGRVDRRLTSLLDAVFEYGPSDVTAEAACQLSEYFSGDRKVFDVPLLLLGTGFQKSVWEHLLGIPYGKTVSYRELACRCGSPAAVRAVANANGANAMSVFVPCHRVISSGGNIGGYAGGAYAKRFLLALERQDGASVLPLPENCCSDSDNRGSVFNGDAPVGGHSDR